MIGKSQTSGAVQRAKTAHRAAFGDAVVRAAVAPGRVNLIGEHTDYNDGLVFPMAIGECCAAVASAKTDGRVRVFACDLPAPGNVFECVLADVAAASGEWWSYAAGPAALLGQRAGGMRGADIAIASDVPLGAGLSSSAAAEVAVATALAELWGVTIAPLELAKLCQRAEHEFAGVPCGLMDQLASVCGVEGHGLLIDCRDNTVEAVALPASDRAAIVVTNSGVRHSLAAGTYARRRAECESAAKVLGLQSLRDATAEMSESAGLTPEQRSCVRHVVAENGRVQEFAAAVLVGDLACAGASMYASHESLRDEYGVSCAELDTLVEIARSAEVGGIHGSRMTGGGFGGCTITLCDVGAVEGLKRELLARYRRAHDRECTVFVVQASAGARLVG